MTRVCEKCGHTNIYWRNFYHHPDVELANLSDVKIPKELKDKYFYYRILEKKQLVYRIPKACVPEMYDTQNPRALSIMKEIQTESRRAKFLKKQTKLPIHKKLSISTPPPNQNSFDDINNPPTNQRKPPTPLSPKL